MDNTDAQAALNSRPPAGRPVCLCLTGLTGVQSPNTGGAGALAPPSSLGASLACPRGTPAGCWLILGKAGSLGVARPPACPRSQAASLGIPQASGVCPRLPEPWSPGALLPPTPGAARGDPGLGALLLVRHRCSPAAPHPHLPAVQTPVPPAFLSLRPRSAYSPGGSGYT